MNIGSLKLDNITVLAPLAGITSLPFRLLAKEAGCALVCSEMISANGLVYQSLRTHELLRSQAEEKPLSVQIFGQDPAIMADAAVLVVASGADILDINLGCAVRKVLKTGSGAALMKEPHKVEKILQCVRKSVNIPLTIKIRSGWEASGSQALKIAKIAQANGIDAITVHPRTALQGFAGKANWSLIKAVKKAVSIPVIGNGDVVLPEDALKMTAATGCDAVMIGRGAIGNPWIFSQVITLLQGGEVAFPDVEQRFETMATYITSTVHFFGEHRASRIIRSQLGWFVKGLRYSSRFRESIKKVSTEKEALTLVKKYKDFLLDGNNKGIGLNK
ncbi:MAG: tRNA dihydrouridine synthase DusB [Desulfobacterales bacterium]|nr:MAG: tRNA dihydrouridine synthase DusB [Desulfobacterales bacterium]